MSEFALHQGRYIRAVALIGLEEIVTEAGGDMGALMALSGLPAGALKNVDTLIPFRGLVMLTERIAAELKIPDLGLRWTACVEPHFANAGPILALFRFTSTAREWLEDALTYWAYHSNAFTMELVENVDEKSSIIREKSTETGLVTRHIAEHTIANLVGFMRQGTGRQTENANVVRFRHRRPENIALHQAFFRCPIEFGCEHNEMEFRSEILDYRTGRMLTPLRPILRRHIQSRIDRMEFYDAAVSTNVALAIASLIGTGESDIATVADALMIHPKKLQRLLKEEGTSFSNILEDVRKTMARDMIANSSAPVAHIAGLLGYSTTAPFTSAFRKWTGMNPLQWRKGDGSKD
jgi:AraC-like DNA-binding protein